ncbi:ABC transporter permease [Rubritalea tangerina]|uniref:ABC transporter permease n=1 Tax=Rubritalea tangerina TaxID=430798 RepID=A0ABW4ZBB6_9BACT
MSEVVKVNPVLEKINDFSDKLSPMLVKELRQGMRGMGFVILFIALQALLVLVMIGFSTASSYGNSGESLSSTLIAFFSLAVMFVQPLRGITALSSEIKGKTIDLMVLTKLSAWRIVFGKWVSLVGQSGLILVTLLPYMIMRYFFGGMQLFAEIALLLLIFVASAALTALTVGLSAVPSIILRGIVCLIGGFFLLQTISMGVIFAREGLVDALTLSDPDALYGLLAFIGVSGYVMWLSLDFGASLIAPLAENRSTPRKLIGYGLVVLATLLMMPVDEDAALILGWILILPLALTALTEHPYLVPQVCLPFVRKFGVGNVTGRVLYPGWASGVFYVASLFVILQVLNAISGFELFDDDELHATVINSFSILVFPLVVYRLFFRKSANIFGIYLAVMMFTWLVGLLALVLAEVTDQDGLLLLFCWLPTANLFGTFSLGNSYEGTMIAFGYLSYIAYSAIALVTSKVVWKHVRESELAAEELIEKK